MKHVSGPWTIRPKRTSKNEIQIDGGGLEIAKIYVTSFTEEKDKANANLIAAAPQLLEACKELLNITRADKNMDIYFKVQDAINKAEGRD